MKEERGSFRILALNNFGRDHGSNWKSEKKPLREVKRKQFEIIIVDFR